MRFFLDNPVDFFYFSGLVDLIQVTFCDIGAVITSEFSIYIQIQFLQARRRVLLFLNNLDQS